MEKQLPTKKFLEEQITSCQVAIFQNQGAINLCKRMLENGMYVEEDCKCVSQEREKTKE